MKKVLNQVVLAFIFATQAFSLAGCTQHVKVFECSLDCADESKLKCSTAVSGSELDFK